MKSIALGKGLPKWIYSGRDYVREKVRIRDGRKCRACGKGWNRKKHRLDVHHLNGLCGKKSRKYDRSADMAKLITLCHSCHLKKHVSWSRSRPNRSPIGTPANIEKARQMIAEGKTYDAVAAQFGVKSSAVQWWLKGRPASYRRK